MWQQNPPIHGFGTKAVHGAGVLKDELGAQQRARPPPRGKSWGMRVPSCAAAESTFSARAGALFVLLVGVVLLG